MLSMSLRSGCFPPKLKLLRLHLYDVAVSRVGGLSPLGARRYSENGARYVPKVHSAVMHSWFRTTPPCPSSSSFSRPSVSPPEGFLRSRPEIAIQPSLQPLRELCFLCTVIFIFSFVENTVRYYRPRNRVAQPESEMGAGEGGTGRYGATENIYVHAVDKITANLHARWLWPLPNFRSL